MEVLKNKVWIACTALLVLHQIFQKIVKWNWSFIDNYADPFLGIPILLGVLLQERKYILSRYFKDQYNENYQLSVLEIIVATIFFTILFEEGFPRWSASFTKDYWDYLAYGSGSFVFYYFINNQNKFFKVPPKTSLGSSIKTI